MNILKALKANEKERVALVDKDNDIVLSFAIGELFYRTSMPMEWLLGEFEVLKDDVAFIVTKSDGSKEIFDNEADASQVIGATGVKRYKEIKEE